jgi:hypothetical protein
MGERYRGGVLAPGHYAPIDPGQTVKQIPTIENVGEQFLCCFGQHDGGHPWAIPSLDNQRKTAAAE